MLRNLLLNKIKASGLSVRAFAIKIGVNYANFNAFLKGAKSLSVEKIEKVLNALNLLNKNNLTFCKFAGNVKCEYCKKVIIEKHFCAGYDENGNEILTDGEEFICIAPIPQCPE